MKEIGKNNIHKKCNYVVAKMILHFSMARCPANFFLVKKEQKVLDETLTFGTFLVLHKEENMKCCG